MKIQIINNDMETILFDIYKWNLNTNEFYGYDHIENEYVYSIYLEDKNDIKFIRKFIVESDEIIVNILFGEEDKKKRVIYSPEFYFNNNNDNVEIKSIID